MKRFSAGTWKHYILACVLALGAASIAAAQDGAGDANANRGLGEMFSDTLRNIINDQNIFIPNGRTAAPTSVDQDDEELFTLNFNNAPIDQVLRFISDLKRKVVLKSDDVDARIDIINPNEVNRDTAMAIIEEAFLLKGFSIIESRDMIVVLPTSVARQRGIELQRDPIDTGSRMTRQVITLQHALPTQLRDALTPLISQDASILADDRTQQLIITDTASNIQSLMAIIRELDREGVASVEVRVFRLRYLDANEMARNLRDLMGNIVTGGAAPTDRRGRPMTPGNIEVMADRTTNSLIITAPPEAINEVARFIERLDVSRSQNMVTRTFTLQNGTATEVAQQLQQLAQSLVTGNYRPSVTADNRTNTVIVYAYQEDVDAVAELIQILDSKQSYERVTQIFHLENADAVILKDLVESLVNQQSAATQNMPWWQRQQMQQGGQVTIVADQRLNALVVTARPADIPTVQRVIQQLDIPQPYSAEEPRIFPVKYQRATDLASLINELFDSSRTTSGPFWQQQQQQTELTNLSGKVRVLPDQTTNSLLVLASTPRAFDVVDRLVAQLDRISPEFGSTRVFNLRNANAESLAEQLNALFEMDPRQQTQQQGFFAFQTQTARQQQSQISNLIGNVRVVPETRTNSLMVTTSSQYFDLIESLVAELDREIGQVLIEILIVEITDFDQHQLGINWADNIPISVEGELSAPLSDIRTSRAAILGQSRFSAVLDFLARNETTNVVARPDILTGDNQSAFVEVIERIPYPSQLNIGTTVATQSFEFEEVGLKLTVQPHINDDDMVTIDVDLETGQVLERFALVSDTGSIPAFARRTVRTRLTVNNEETAVLSGVIDSTWRDTVDGIPGLKDIPVLGYLFKSKGREQMKKELVAFITPYILTTQEQRSTIYHQRQDRLNRYEGFNNQMLDLDVRYGVQQP